MSKIRTMADVDKLPEGEVSAFLKEWFDDRDYVLGHTSGSTGTPKEIRLKKEDMRASARLTNEFFGIGADSRLLLCLSVNYIAGKMMVVRALEAGAELLEVAVSSRPFESFEGEEVIDLAAMVPMQVEKSCGVDDDRKHFSHVRNLLIGGAPVLPSLERKLGELPAKCYATYGMTETLSHVALRCLTKNEPYFALGDITFAVDERQCLVVRTPHLSEKEFVTNDLVELVDERHFWWTGRYDNVINCGGIKFSPEEIEKKVAHLMRGRRFFVASRRNELLGEELVMVIEGKRPGFEEANRWLPEIESVLSPYERPKAYLFRTHLRETPSGKIIRSEDGLQS